MSQREMPHSHRSGFRIGPLQGLAIALSILFGLAIIINVQLAGNALWFWYAKLLHQGVKLYADLHIVLQPLFVLDYNAWMHVVGVNCIGIEVMSFIHVLILIAGIALLVRQSSWTDAQKALLQASAFVLIIQFVAYLFNDYHITSDIFSLYSILLLLWFAREDKDKNQLLLSIALGVIAGLSLENRLNDGAAMVASLCCCIPLVARRRKLLLTLIAVLAAVLTIVLVVHLTGDTFSAYVSNSVLKASGSKGGTGTILKDPVLLVVDALKDLWEAGKGPLVLMAAVVAAGYALSRFWKLNPWAIVLVQLALFAFLEMFAPTRVRNSLHAGNLADILSVLFVVLSYALVPVVLFRFLRSRFSADGQEWDSREAVVLLVALLTAAGSGSTGGSAHNFYCTFAALLLMVPIFQPFWKQRSWLYPGFISVLIVLTAGCVQEKIHSPYSWHNYRSSPMFEGRAWYQHPVYGPMYIERDELNFILPVCNDIAQGDAPVELLSLPYPYPNYFCNVTPWHGYVQTFYDTSPRATIEKLMGELQTVPPQWIVYQREMDILKMHEKVYNHDQRLAQHDLDDLIMQKIASGQWQLVENRKYLTGDGWLIIRTRR